MKSLNFYSWNVGWVSVSIREICVRLSMPVIFSPLHLYQFIHPIHRFILSSIHPGGLQEHSALWNPHTNTDSKTRKLDCCHQYKFKHCDCTSRRNNAVYYWCICIKPEPLNHKKRPLLSRAQLKVYFRPWSLFQAIKLPGTKETTSCPAVWQTIPL